MEPADGGGAVREVNTALHREQAGPAVVIRPGEEHDALGKAAGVRELRTCRASCGPRRRAGIRSPGMLMWSSRRPWRQVTFSTMPHIHWDVPDSGISRA